MNNVISICQDKTVYTRQELNALIPLLTKITERHEGLVAKYLESQSWIMRSGGPKMVVDSYDNKVGNELAKWGKKITKLGGKVFQGGYIGFDTSFGYWSWHYGEKEVRYYHNYDEGPEKRREISVFALEHTNETPAR